MKLSRRNMLLVSAGLPLVKIGKAPEIRARDGFGENEFMHENDKIYDCVIVGGGVAGLSAALNLGRARRRVLVCDKNSPRNVWARNSHGFLTRDNAPPLELLEIGREQLKPYKTVRFQPIGVREITKTGERFEIAFDDGAAARARKILLAFGVKDEFPPIENFAEFWGKTVFHCPFCHGYEVRDRPLAAIGNGANGFGMIALLKSWSRDLALCTNGRAELSADERKLLAKHNVPIREEKIVRFEGKNGRLETIVFERGDKLHRSGMLIRLPQKLRSDLAQKLGCELTETGHIKVAGFNETTVKGVYAAGDATSPMQSIAVAVSQGALAAGAGINHALGAQDFV